LSAKNTNIISAYILYEWQTPITIKSIQCSFTVFLATSNIIRISIYVIQSLIIENIARTKDIQHDLLCLHAAPTV